MGKIYGDPGLKRNPTVGSPVRLRQNGVAGRIVEEKLASHGAYIWRVVCEDGYEAWFPAEGLMPNEDVS